jgi:DNA polymerase-3 subunit alpha
VSKATKLKPSDFVHLHNHTQYSLLDGLTKIPALIDEIKSMGMEAVAMTDHGTLSGAIEFYKTASKNEIKPIVGMEAYVASRKHTDKEAAHDKQYFHLIILAMNHTGYQNLMRLSTIANLEGFYYKPRIDHELLEKYNEGLIILSGCINGEVGDALRQGQYDQAKKIAEWYKGVFGDRYYIEIQDHGHPDHPSHWVDQIAVNEQAFKLAKELGVKPVITGDAHYLKAEDQEAHEILLCVQTGSFLSDEKRMSLKDFELHVSDPTHIIARWGAEHPEAITNTKEVADRCSLSLELGKILIPEFATPKGESEKSYLDMLVYRGLAWRYGGVDEKKAEKLSIDGAKKTLPEDVAKRAEYELGVIEKMGFNGYFLIIADFINWGKDQGIVFGPGRGSAAGSIIAYALKITELDPIAYDLLFERFLNPDRISMPDIDIDIQDTRRDEVIQYCIDKYGKDRVANIVTFGRMAARNAVRDVARVLQVPYAESDRLAKMIPPPVQGRHIPLEVSLQNDADLKREYENNQQAKQVFDLAIRLEGTIRSHGVHAAGVVIAPDDIVKFTPLEMAQKGVVSTQYSMGPVEDLGLLKMDFLGLSNLTIIKNAIRIIRKVYGKSIELETLPLDDIKTFELLQRGDTTGVFQLESAGMKRYLKELKPTMFDDIIAMVALYRPGPMQFIDDFIARKHGLKKIEYLHPKMENALKSTYGVLVYQEQFMQISKDLAGFSGGQADTLRKAVGKKIMEMMRKVKPEFIDGAVQHSGADRALMEKFWAQLEEFANYCFNKSHAACYGIIAYWTAYLKAHYPAAFMAALMTSDYDDIDRLAIEISECKHMGIEVLPPDVNESFAEFAVVRTPDKPDQIRFGMNAIKNVGSGAVEEILRARSIDGTFKDLQDFLHKTSPRIVNRKALESLIKAGAFDRFEDRSLLLANIETLLAYATRIQKDQASGQTDLFGSIIDDNTDYAPKLILEEATEVHTSRERLFWERELLGLYLSSHPLQEYEVFLREQTVNLTAISPDMDGKTVRIGGAVVDMREITTKNGQKMAFIKIADLNGEIELILFPNAYQQTIGIWQRDQVVLVNGKISAKDRDGNIGNEVKVMVDDAREVTPDQAAAYQETGKTAKVPKPSKSKKVSAKSPPEISASAREIEKRVYIRIVDTKDHKRLNELKNIVDQSLGITPLVLVIGDDSEKQIVKLPNSIDANEKVLGSLAELFGNEAVKFQ